MQKIDKFCRGLWGPPGNARSLLLALHSQITPGGAWENIWDGEDRTCVGCMQGKSSTHCALAPNICVSVSLCAAVPAISFLSGSGMPGKGWYRALTTLKVQPPRPTGHLPQDTTPQRPCSGSSRIQGLPLGFQFRGINANQLAKMP